MCLLLLNTCWNSLQSSTALQPDMTKTKVLFVCKGWTICSATVQAVTSELCLQPGNGQQPARHTVHGAGNICRSPAAGAVLKKVVERSGIADEFEIDSCGTGGSGHEDWYSVTASSSSTQVCICTFTRHSSLRHSVACFLYQAIFAISMQYPSLHAAQML